MKFFLIVNPISGDKDKQHLITGVKEALKPSDTVTVYTTTGNNDLANIANELGKEAYNRILVAGGDGTIKLAAEASNAYDMPIGILPAGSANGLATDFGIPEKPEDFIPIALYGTTKQMDVIRINNNYCLHISDLGINAELIREFENSNLRGKLGYAVNGITTLVKNDAPYKFTLQIGDTVFEEEGIMLAFANSRKYGTGAVINPQGCIDDGVFEVLIFKKLDVVEILKSLGDPEELSDDFVISKQVTEVLVTTSTPVPFQVDGEFCKQVTSVKVSIMPGKLAIAVP